MAFEETLAQVKADPRFQKLTYSDQQKVIAELLAKKVKENPQIMALQPQDQQIVAQDLFQKYVNGYTPTLRGFSGQLTDEDRATLDAQYNPNGLNVVASADPNINYKIPLYLAERMDKGDLTAQVKAKAWIATNRVINESLIAKIALGAKDAVEQLFGTDDQAFNDLAFHSIDYSNLSEMLVSKMSKANAIATKSAASTVGFVTGMAENIALTSIFGGAGPGSGLFLKNVWKGLDAKAALAVGSKAIGFYSSTAPRMVSAAAQGVVDVARSLPRLLEQGDVYGPKSFWEGVATAYGTGVAFDLFGNLVNDAFKIAVKPLGKVFGKTLEIKNEAQAKELGALLQSVTDPNRLKSIYNSFTTGQVPKEILDQLDDASRKEVLDKITQGFAMMRKFNANPRSPDGFRVLAKAMGFDTNFVEDGIELVDLAGNKILKQNMVEAASFMQDNLPKGLGNLNDEITGAISHVRLTVQNKVALQPTEVPMEQLKSTLFRNIDYAPDAKQTQRTLKTILEVTNPPVKTIREVSEQDFQKAWVNGQMPKDAILMPNAITSKTTSESLTLYMNDLVGSLTGPVAYQETSVEALRTAIKQINPTASIVVDGRGYHLALDGGVTSFSRFEDLNEQVWKTLYDSGALTFEDLNKLVRTNTGMDLIKSIDKATGVEHYVLRGMNENNRIARDFNTLDELFAPENATMFGTKLPEALRPGVGIGLDGGVYFSHTMVAGTPMEMTSFMKDFNMKPTKVGTVLRKTLADGSKVSVKTTGKSSYFIEIPELGFSQQFSTIGQARKAWDKLASAGDSLEAALSKKMITIRPLPNGNIGVVDKVGKMSIFNDGTELRKWLASVPDDPELNDLLVYNQSYDADTIKAVVDTVSHIDWQPHVDDLLNGAKTVGEKINKTKFSTTIDPLIKPAESYLRQSAYRYNQKVLQETVDSVSSGVRALSKESSRWDVIPETIFKGTSLVERKLTTILLQTNDENWSKVAKAVMGNDYELSAADVSRVVQIRSFYETLQKKFNIDAVGTLKNYIPHMKPIRTTGEMMDILASNPMDKIGELFPGMQLNPTLEMVARNGRLDDFINQHNEQDILKITKMYINRGLREQYLQGPMKRLFDWTQGAKGQVPDSVWQAADRYRMAILGIPDATTIGQQELSLKVTTMLANVAKKAAKVFNEPVPKLGASFESIGEVLPTTDVLGAINRNTMAAVMAFRPFSAARNGMEAYMKAWPNFGIHYSKATGEITYEYIAGLFDRGLLEGKMFEGSENVAKSTLANLKERGMKWIQNSEIFSRAIVAKSTENAFDAGLDRLASGAIKNADQFRDIARLNFLEDAEFAPIWSALQKGQLATAKDVAVERSLSVILGSFKRENKPKLFTGYFGKLFGTFGVFTASTIDFYRHVLANGPISDRVFVATKIAFASTMLINGLRALGVDYSGFGLTDTMTFGGGPVWSSIVDVTKVAGGTPDSASSARNLLKNWSVFIPNKGLNIPKLLMPGANQMNYTIKGVDDLFKGNNGAWQELLGAPALQGPFTWKFF